MAPTTNYVVAQNQDALVVMLVAIMVMASMLVILILPMIMADYRKWKAERLEKKAGEDDEAG